MNNYNNSWDARTFDKASINVQLEWGRKLLEKRQWVGNEIVMDVGAGSDNLTKILVDKVPCRYVYAVDADANMVQLAKSNLSDYKNVQVICSSMRNVNLPTKVDVIFSNAALHWILNRDHLFSYFWQLLRPNDGAFDRMWTSWKHSKDNIDYIQKIMQSDQFREDFANWNQPWHLRGRMRPRDCCRIKIQRYRSNFVKSSHRFL